MHGTVQLALPVQNSEKPPAGCFASSLHLYAPFTTCQPLLVQLARTDCTTNACVGVACGRVCLIFISVCVSVRSLRTRIDPRSFQFSLRSMYLVPSRTALHLHGNVWCVDDAAECRHIQCHGHAWRPGRPSALASQGEELRAQH